MKFILLLTALLAGMLAPLQAGLNGKMGRAIGDPVYAALISFVVGALGLFCYAAATRVNFAAIRQASNMDYAVWGAGILGVQVQPFGWQRLAGIALITAGVVIFRNY